MSALKKRLFLMDGSFDQELKEVGSFNSQDNLFWTFGAITECPNDVKEVHRRFLRARVDFITTNTYHAALETLRKNGLDGPALIKKAVSILKEVIAEEKNSNVKILGSVGSYAVTRRDQSEYTGKYVDDSTVDIMKAMKEYHLEQARELISNGISTIIFETIATLIEVEAICAALDELDVVAIVSLTCQPDKPLLRHGELFAEVAMVIVNHSKVIGIGINCTHIFNITPLLKSIQHLNITKDIYVYPNTGVYEHYGNNRLTTKELTSTFLNSIEEWRSLGVVVIGGCCGVSTIILREVGKKIKSLNEFS